MISVFNHQKDLKISKGSVRTLVEAVLEYLAVSYKELSVYFISKKKILELHEEFFGDPSPTDCISFPLDEEHLGEIFVCPKTALEYSKKHKLDPLEETALYMIHGLLHLIGYDDLNEKDRRIMRKKEKSCIRHLYSHKIQLKPK